MTGMSVQNGCVFQTFSDFELEAHLECAYDRLDIFDGDDDSAPLIGRYCGSTRPLPDTVVAQGNRLFMTFISDASVQRNGFSAVHSTGLTESVAHLGSIGRQGHSQKFVWGGYKSFLGGIKLFNSCSDVIFTP